MNSLVKWHKFNKLYAVHCKAYEGHQDSLAKSIQFQYRCISNGSNYNYVMTTLYMLSAIDLDNKGYSKAASKSLELSLEHFLKL